jgi:putative phosphoesterase
MKLGVIADVHGNHLALAEALAALAGRTDQTLFLGDLCGYYPFVNECADLLHAASATGICGNHDAVFRQCRAAGEPPSAEYERRYGSALRRSLERASRQTLSLMERFSETWSGECGSVKVAAFHGAPWNVLEGRVYPDCSDWTAFDTLDADIVLLGHTHYPMVVRRGAQLIVNPGSVGQARDRRPGAAFAIVDTAAMTVDACRVPFDAAPIVSDARCHDPQLPYLVDVLTRT